MGSAPAARMALIGPLRARRMEILRRKFAGVPHTQQTALLFAYACGRLVHESLNMRFESLAEV